MAPHAVKFNNDSLHLHYLAAADINLLLVCGTQTKKIKSINKKKHHTEDKLAVMIRH
jgi:hypothetical protein